MKLNKHHDITIGELETYLNEETELGETPEEVSKNLIKGLFTEDILDYDGRELATESSRYGLPSLSHEERIKVVIQRAFYKEGGIIRTAGDDPIENYDRKVQDLLRYGQTQYGLPTGRENRMLRANKKL